MATGNITKTAVERLAEGWLWDSGPRAVVGFGARRQTDGVFYYLRYRVAGRQRFKSIGRHGSPWTPDQARNEARRLLGLVAGGTDPGLRANQAETFGAEIERYLALRQPAMKPKSHAETARHLRKHAKPLHRLALAEIDRRAIAERLARIEIESGPVARNGVRSSLSAFFAWAIREGLLDANPVTGTGKADTGGSRTRVLTDVELAAVWHCLGQDQYGDIVRLLILTGQRREEIGGLRWSEIAATEGHGLIVLGPERTKNSQEHRLPLSSQARAIIDRQPRRNSSPFVFPAGAQAFTGWSNAKARLDARIGAEGACNGLPGAPAMPPWRLHDLRRTMATRLGDLGVLPHVVEAILNHISGFRSGVAGVYNLARYENEMREALARWADYVESLVGPLPLEHLPPGAAPRPKTLRLVRVAPGMGNA